MYSKINLKSDLKFFSENYYASLALLTTFQVVAVDLNPYYLNEEEPVCKKLYTAGITHFKTLANIFSKEKNCICKVSILSYHARFIITCAYIW